MATRGIRDLRELVVVSRLTYRDSDSDSDDGRAGLITPFEQLNVNDSGSYHSTDDERLPRCVPSPTSPVLSETTPPSSADSGVGHRRRKKKKPKGYRSSVASRVIVTEFPKAKPLPSVGEKFTAANGYSAASQPSVEKKDYSDVMSHIDENIVAEWLERANDNLKELTEWCTDQNFVTFAQFWITDFGIEKRCEILALENSILLDELTLAFTAAMKNGYVTTRDIVDLLSALFREYPRKLTMSAGVYLFLDYLDVFTSERALEYRKILSDVRISTTNKHHVQLLLASRCFILINVWVAIVNFYRAVDASAARPKVIGPMTYREKADVIYIRLVEALTFGLVEVVHYYLYSGKISAGFVDSRKKTILHIATAANKPRMVEYLLKKWVEFNRNRGILKDTNIFLYMPKSLNPCSLLSLGILWNEKWTGCMDVNRACDTDNSPLHIAVNLGSIDIAKMLLMCLDIQVNKTNNQCNGATPLHLAVIHGNVEMVKLLLKHKANPLLNMEGRSAIQVAEDFEQTEILSLLKSYDFNS